MKTFTGEWERYIKTVYPDWDELGAEQRKQIFMAFHAGGLAVFGIISALYHREDLDAEEKGEALALIQKEVIERCEEYLGQHKSRN